MSIDIASVNQMIEELGLEGADKDYVTKVLTTNERAATQFIGQRMRHNDYTAKTQGLAKDRQTLEQRVNDQVSQYAQQLSDADERIKRIMKDFEAERISRATADARLLKVKEVYNLSDEDIPAVDPPRGQPNSGITNSNGGNGLTEDRVVQILGKFRQDLIKEIGPELKAFPRVAAIMDDIDAQHRELTGKRLTYQEKQELIVSSEAENGPTLLNAWRDKYKIGEIEENKRFDDRLKTEKQKWDDEQKARVSSDAMRTVRTGQGELQSVSPVFRQYDKHTDNPDRFSNQNQNANNGGGDGGDGGGEPKPKLSGAERAAQRYLERRNRGVPMGVTEPAGAK